MFKLVVLSALVAVAAAKPSGLFGHSAVVAAPLAYSVPSAVSHTYRQDVVSKPVVATYAAAPVVAETVVAAAPVAYTVPQAVSHSYRKDVISKPAVVAYEAHAPVVAETPVVYSAPVAEAIVAPAAVSSTYRQDIVSSPVVAKTYVSSPVVSYAAHAPAVHAW